MLWCCFSCLLLCCPILGVVTPAVHSGCRVGLSCRMPHGLSVERLLPGYWFNVTATDPAKFRHNPIFHHPRHAFALLSWRYVGIISFHHAFWLISSLSPFTYFFLVATPSCLSQDFVIHRILPRTWQWKSQTKALLSYCYYSLRKRMEWEHESTGRSVRIMKGPRNQKRRQGAGDSTLSLMRNSNSNERNHREAKFCGPEPEPSIWRSWSEQTNDGPQQAANTRRDAPCKMRHMLSSI